MPAPAVPGIYVVTLQCDELMPVTQDSRYVATCARVNRLNVKVGKACDLAVRERNYWSDFGRENVVFAPVAMTTRIVEAETAVLRALARFRKRNPIGGRMDWLEGIGVDAVVAQVQAALQSANISYAALLADASR